MRKIGLCMVVVITTIMLGSCSIIGGPNLSQCINRFFGIGDECSLRQQMDSIEAYTDNVFDDIGWDIDVNATMASTIGYDGESRISFSLNTPTNLIDTNYYDKFLEFYPILREDLDSWIDKDYTLTVSISDYENNNFFYTDIVYENHRVVLSGREYDNLFAYIDAHSAFLQHVLDYSDFESNAIDIWFDDRSDVIITKENQGLDVSILWDPAGTTTSVTDVINYLNQTFETYTFIEYEYE